MKYEFLKDCPDIHHTFYSLAALSITANDKGLSDFDPLLSISI